MIIDGLCEWIGLDLCSNGAYVILNCFFLWIGNNVVVVVCEPCVSFEFYNMRLGFICLTQSVYEGIIFREMVWDIIIATVFNVW